jgi:uncharacterized membrane protein (UPF0127 family)
LTDPVPPEAGPRILRVKMPIPRGRPCRTPFPAWASRLGAAILVAGFLAGSASGCREPNKPAATADASDPVVVMIGGKPFRLEVVATENARQLGLMYRTAMPADAGMIFVFRDAKEQKFWMKNTKIPLDIIYLDSAGRVVSVKQMAPLDETGVQSDGPARFAIELNQGTAARVGVKAGNSIDLPARVTNPPELE